jgi:hypothetical protein
MLGPISIKRVLGIYSLKNFIIDDIIGYYDSSVIREIKTFQSYHDHPIEIFYLFCFSSFILLYIMKNTKREIKIRNLIDKSTSRYVKVFIIIFTMIFTKDIENAI